MAATTTSPDTLLDQKIQMAVVRRCQSRSRIWTPHCSLANSRPEPDHCRRRWYMHGGEVGHPFPSGCADIDPIGAAWEQPQQIPRDWAKLAARRQAMRGIHALPRWNGGPFLFFASLAMAYSPRRRRTSSFLCSAAARIKNGRHLGFGIPTRIVSARWYYVVVLCLWWADASGAGCS